MSDESSNVRVLFYIGSNSTRIYSAQNPAWSLLCHCKHMKSQSKWDLAWGPETQWGSLKGQVLCIQAISPGRRADVNNYIQIVTFSDSEKRKNETHLTGKAHVSNNTLSSHSWNITLGHNWILKLYFKWLQ